MACLANTHMKITNDFFKNAKEVFRVVILFPPICDFLKIQTGERHKTIIIIFNM